MTLKQKAKFAKLSAAQKKAWKRRKAAIHIEPADRPLDEPLGLEDPEITSYKQWLDEASSPAERQHRKKLMYGLMYGGAYGSKAVTHAWFDEAPLSQASIEKVATDICNKDYKRPETNPKTLTGQQKVPVLSVVPPASIIAQATAMRYGAYLAPRVDGKRGYGPYNWRDQPIEAHIYIDAAMRHLMQWFDGEEHEIITDDQGRAIDTVSHLAFALATIGILLDAQANQTLIDDRPANRQQAATNLLNRHKLARYEK